MKASNSSSSSFCIYGIQMDASKLNKLLSKKTGKKLLNEDDDDYDGNEDVYEIVEKAGLSFDDMYGECFIGLPWAGVGDNETGLQFKARTEALLKELLGPTTKFKCGTHEEAWRDG